MLAFYHVLISTWLSSCQFLMAVEPPSHLEREMESEALLNASWLPEPARETIHQAMSQMEGLRLHELEISRDQQLRLLYVAEFSGQEGNGKLFVSAEGKIEGASGLCRVPVFITIDELPLPTRATSERMAHGKALYAITRASIGGRPVFQTSFREDSLISTLFVDANGNLVRVLSRWTR